MAIKGTQALHVGLGAFSLALGAAPLVAPRAVARVAGLSTGRRSAGSFVQSASASWRSGPGCSRSGSRRGCGHAWRRT